VTLDDRRQFTQIGEPFTDDFTLADLNLRYDFGGAELTSITSFTDRDVLVVRDATALTASITGGSIGLPANIYNLNAPLNDTTHAKVWTEELRLAGGKNKFHWVVGGFYSDNKRDYDQKLLVSGFQDLSGIPTVGLRAPKDVLFFSDLHYKLKQFALFGEGTLTVGDRVDLTAGLRYYDFNEDREQVFDGIFGNDNNGTSLVSTPGSTDAQRLRAPLHRELQGQRDHRLNAQVSRGFRLGGINDPLNVPSAPPRTS
jgi:iron complex outermembrane receptor protein